MKRYQHILLAVDLSPECQQPADAACALAQANDAKLSLIHAIEPMAFAYQGEIPIDLLPSQEQQYDTTKQQLAEFAAGLSVPCDRQIVAMGQPHTEIHDAAKALNADLIVVGSHGRHGLALLLGSTANSVLHGAECDVLAVRVRDED